LHCGGDADEARAVLGEGGTGSVEQLFGGAFETVQRLDMAHLIWSLTRSSPTMWPSREHLSSHPALLPHTAWAAQALKLFHGSELNKSKARAHDTCKALFNSFVHFINTDI